MADCAITPLPVLISGCVAVIMFSGCVTHEEPSASTTPPAIEQAQAQSSEPERSAPDHSAAEPSEATTEPQLVEAFPHIRIDRDRRIVEFDARISPLIDPTGEGRVFYLEQVICTPSTKEHESLIVTQARPAHLHAALLMIGAENGHPVYWTYPEGRAVVHAPDGDPLAIEVEYVDENGQTITRDPLEWAITRDRSARFPHNDGRWLFAGSTERETSRGVLYEADAAGTIVGLASFGSEVIAWSVPISHEEAKKELEWVADQEAMPPASTPVHVRIRAVE